MPSNGSRHNDEALGSAGDSDGNAGIPNVFEEASPDLTVGEDAPSEIVSLRNERDELLDALRRNQADFENYKKRVERQSQELRDRANERIVEALIPALDAFALARAHLSDSDLTAETKSLLQAASLFESALQKEGLERITDVGVDFDPNSHEAVEHVDADAPAADGEPVGSDSDSDVAEGEIVDGPKSAGQASLQGPTVDSVFRPGYIWKGRVIRPAMVRVRG